MLILKVKGLDHELNFCFSKLFTSNTLDGQNKEKQNAPKSLGVSVSPSHFHFTQEQGQIKTYDITVKNTTSTAKSFNVNIYDFDMNGKGKSSSTDSLRINKDTASLAEIISSLEKIYCGNLGIEYNYISSINERQWFQQRLEPNLGKIDFTDDEKVYIHKRLSSADGLAKFLASRYPGMKRFGIEGAESLIPLVDSLIQNCGIFGAQQICFGMAHRGRLNLLVNVLGK